MNQDRPRRGPLLWALAPKRALAAETGLSTRQAGSFARLSRRRRRPWLPLVVLVQVSVMVGWVSLMSSFVGIYETVTTFGPDGAMESETTTGPFGITVFPLFFGVLLGPFLALVFGAIAGFAAHFLLIDCETRRCARTPACFRCGYDLSAVVGTRCPECGTEQAQLARAARGDSGRIVHS